MEAYVAGDYTKGDAKMLATKPLYDRAFSSCGDIGHHMKELAQNVDDLISKNDWLQVSNRIYEENKDLIDMNVDL